MQSSVSIVLQDNNIGTGLEGEIDCDLLLSNLHHHPQKSVSWL